VPRRVSLPAADDLFRPSVTAVPDPAPEPDAAAGPSSDGETVGKPARRSSGRVKHDEKMTVYVTADELLDLEHARLSIRRDLGVAVDRGRLVREALAIVLADLEESGAESQLARRLTGG
jgi:hypothetical protein